MLEAHRDAENETHRARQARRTREALFASGRALFAAHGFAATTVEQIVARAGMTRGAFYKHFDDKHALFDEVVRAMADELVEHIWGRSYELASHRVERERFAARLFLARMSEAEVHRTLVIDGPAVLGYARWSRILADSVFAPLHAGVSGWSDDGSVPRELVAPLTQLLTGTFQAAASQLASADDPAARAREYEDALVYLIRSLRGDPWPDPPSAATRGRRP